MKKVYWIFFLFLLLPLLAIAQTVTPTPIPPLLNPPTDTGEFIGWLFSSVKSLSGASSTLIIAFVLTVIIGAFKLTPLIKYWDKLGKWKFTVPLLLAAVVEVLMNMPKPFAWGAFISQLIVGAFGTGTVAIALKTIWNQLFPKPETPPTP
jgi:hypothetical protein